MITSKERVIMTKYNKIITLSSSFESFTIRKNVYEYNNTEYLPKEVIANPFFATSINREVKT
jgi:hypothetical protein